MCVHESFQPACATVRSYFQVGLTEDAALTGFRFQPKPREPVATRQPPTGVRPFLFPPLLPPLLPLLLPFLLPFLLSFRGRATLAARSFRPSGHALRGARLRGARGILFASSLPRARTTLDPTTDQ